MVDADITLMSEWCEKFSDYASRQAGLDVKFVADRYLRGKTEVENFMLASHKFLQLPSYTAAQSEILSFCNQANGGSGGGQGLLDSNFRSILNFNSTFDSFMN